MIKRALLSVSDKTGLLSFAKGLAELGIEIVSTGGTARLLTENGLSVTPVDKITEFPEMMDGRVKTLHPKVHGGLLGVRDNTEHQKQAKEQSIEWIDLVVVNLYPFEATVAKPDVTLEEAVENIDIGGPAMLRSAAKNFRFVTVLTDPSDYDRVIEKLKTEGDIPLRMRQEFAVKVFRKTADYDAAIDQYLSKQISGEPSLRLSFQNGRSLRYGENSHQSASFFIDSASTEPCAARAELLSGKEMSYNNYVDADAALEAVKELQDSFGVAVIKHTNPCGFATGDTIREALENAWKGDPVSAFGSVIACSRAVTLDFAHFLKGKNEKHTGFVIENGKLKPQDIPGKFVEAIIAPDFEDDAFEFLSKTKTLRLLKCADLDSGKTEPKTWRKITGGILEMDRDLVLTDQFNVVTRRAFEAEKRNLAEFAMKACKHTKSNAIILAREYKSGCFHLVGMGAGQPNRVDSLRKLAVTKAVENLQIEYDLIKPEMSFEEYRDNAFRQMVLASDAFFPFDDTVRTASEYGICYIVQPGGSVRDEDSVKACDELNMAMAFTGLRHFRH